MRRFTDALLALALGVEMQVELMFVDAPRGDLLAARAAVLGLAGAVAVRGRAPIAAAAVALAVITVLERLDPAVDAKLVGPFFSALLISYSVGAHTEGRRLLAGVAVLGVGCVVAIRLDDPPGGLDDFVFAGTIIVGGPVMIGRLVRSRTEVNRALRERAATAAADSAAAAVADERARIAGELHHLVRDALTAMVGHATEAEQLARRSPDGARFAFAAVERTGRDALGEIRGLLGVLRREDEELALAPQPSLAHLADLVARVRAAGLPVELEVDGEPPPLPAGVDLTAYRVVQEALAGARHAHRATVTLRYGAAELTVAVTDTGDAATARPLLGIRERVALYGGELETSLDGSGHAVRARLPLERVT